LIPGGVLPETENEMNNYYLASQLVADRQAAVAAGLAHHAQVKDARAARKAVSAHDPTLIRRLVFGRVAHAGA